MISGSGQHFRDLAPGSADLLRICHFGARSEILPDSTFRTSEPEPRFWRQSAEIPKSREILEILKILGNPGNRENLDFSRKVVISAISRISGSHRFLEISHARCVYES